MGTVEKALMGKKWNTIIDACTQSSEWKNGKRYRRKVRI